ncbi:response regulator transcription factor [Thermodesulfobacteriota bacterium]
MAKKVLIVDDEMHVIKIMQFKLKKEGFDVISAQNGNDAIEIAKKELPDIILLDIMMPDINGYMVLEALKAEDSTKDIPVIMVTAKTQESNKIKAEKLGIADYIFKPFSLQHVVESIQRII